MRPGTEHYAPGRVEHHQGDRIRGRARACHLRGQSVNRGKGVGGGRLLAERGGLAAHVRRVWLGDSEGGASPQVR